MPTSWKRTKHAQWPYRIYCIVFCIKVSHMASRSQAVEPLHNPLFRFFSKIWLKFHFILHAFPEVLFFSKKKISIFFVWLCSYEKLCKDHQTLLLLWRPCKGKLMFFTLNFKCWKITHSAKLVIQSFKHFDEDRTQVFCLHQALTHLKKMSYHQCFNWKLELPILHPLATFSEWSTAIKLNTINFPPNFYVCLLFFVF